MNSPVPKEIQSTIKGLAGRLIAEGVLTAPFLIRLCPPVQHQKKLGPHAPAGRHVKIHEVTKTLTQKALICV